MNLLIAQRCYISFVFGNLLKKYKSHKIDYIYIKSGDQNKGTEN